MKKCLFAQFVAKHKHFSLGKACQSFSANSDKVLLRTAQALIQIYEIANVSSVDTKRMK